MLYEIALTLAVASLFVHFSKIEFVQLERKMWRKSRVGESRGKKE